MTAVEHALSIALNHAFLLPFIYMLTDFKAPQKKWKTVWIVCAICLSALCQFSILAGYGALYDRALAALLVFFHFLLLALVSRRRGWRLLFNLCTVMLISAISACLVKIIVNLLAAPVLFGFVTRFFCLLLSLFFILYIRPIYLRMVQILDYGWFFLSGVPFLLTIFIFVENRILHMPVSWHLCITTLICILCGFLYYTVVIMLFAQVEQKYETQRDSDLLHVQIKSLLGRIQDAQATEEATRIEHHDMRHQLNIISALLEEKKLDEAQDYIQGASNRLDALKLSRWCIHPSLNAVFSVYFAKAKKAGVEVDARLDLSLELPVDSRELSIVFANALQNAIDATSIMPEGQRHIKCVCLSAPQLMFEISNTYSGKVLFNHAGQPVAAHKGHGIGTRSIMAFVKKYEATYQYEARDGWFTLTIVV